MDFHGITHIIENPVGHAPGFRYSLVGAVFTCMMDARTPTAADIMGGRVQKDGKAYHGRKWESVDEIRAEARQHPEVKLCESPTCACRALFPAPPSEAKPVDPTVFAGPFPRGKHAHKCCAACGAGSVACYKKQCNRPNRGTHCGWCKREMGGAK